MRLDRTTQDWQIEAQEMHSKYNRFNPWRKKIIFSI